VSRRTQEPLGRERSFDYRAVTFSGRPFQTGSSTPFLSHSHLSGPTTPRGTPLGLGCSRFARRYSGNRICFLLLRVLRCFSSPGVPSMPYGFRHGSCPITGRGFPHSDISGSTLAYSSPKRFGVCPVLHRLLVPRHPPCALSSLTYSAFRLLPYCLASAPSSLPPNNLPPWGASTPAGEEHLASRTDRGTSAFPVI
jgi:hypothetical protein